MLGRKRDYAVPRIIKILLLSVIAVFVAAMAWFLIRSDFARRSIPGHIVRRFQGESGIAQDLNDLAEDINSIPALKQLQPWAVQTLNRYREGRLETNGYAQFYWDDPPAVRLSRRERPEFIDHQWGVTNEYGEEEPEIFIVSDTNRQPEAVAIGWYMYGIQIGLPEYRLSYASNYYCPYVQVKPGVYVYGNYK
jgi:hypothetical protein